VIQKHAATRLHYDFRLELDGVLLSWAVPKGPSYDPAEKRLAVHVEDHPLEYGGFEGVIPMGEYGGGCVILWDRGTWEPVGDPKAGLQKGHLQFVLHGEKCRGGWHLARMGAAAAGDGHENWLLIKRRDDEADAGKDVTELEPRSVATGRSIDEVGRDRDRVWSSRKGEVGPKKPKASKVSVEGARRAAIPERLSPELCTLVEEAPRGEEWVHEIKLDGYRAVIRVDGGEARAFSRSDREWTGAWKPILAHAASLPCEQAWIDGEVVVLDAEGKSDFQALQADLGAGRTDRLVFFAFDLVYLDGWDLRPAKLVDRKAALAELLSRGTSGPIRLLDYVRGKGETFFSQVCEFGLEGSISKRADAPYKSARTKDWLKIKCIGREDFLIGGFTRPKGSRSGFGSLLLGARDPDGSLRYVGRAGTGFTDATIRELMEQLKPLVTSECPFSEKPVAGATWVRPELVASVAFSEWTNDGLLRHPSFKGLRVDLDPADVATPAQATAGRSSRPKPHVEVKARLTNPQRVLWKATGVTKRELAEYYARNAERILPHLVGRPLTLLRCPSGIDEEKGSSRGCFYQKHANDTVPDALHRVDVKTEKEPYLYLDDEAGLLALAQMGVLEIHPWGSRVETLEQPDRLIFDLDPDEDLPWERVAEAARTVKSRLDALGLESWAKTTGGKGLHVCVPLVADAGWEDCKAFCEAVAEAISRSEPKKYTSKVAKARRHGKVLVDWLRNTRGATAVAAWSTRARRGATISVPLAWDEIDTRPAFDLRNIEERLSSLAKDPWAEFGEVRQSLTEKVLSKLH
jgi:bifunctional non-homologous end joining protein LigD